MTRIRCLLAILLAITLTADASAQFFVPVFGLPVIAHGGVDFQYNSRRLQINGFFPTGNPYGAIVPVTPTPFGLRQVGPAYIPYGYARGYGSIDQRVTVTIITPPRLAPTVGLRRMPDLSGIDLDVEPASKIWGEKKGEVVKAPMDDKKIEIVKADPPAPKPAAAKPAPPLPPDGKRLNDDGITAFRNGEFGVALLRFRQADDADEPAPRAIFLRAQACIAVGKYHEAVQLIQQGLKRQPDWPNSGFQPKVELYGDQPGEWKAHRQLLEQTQERNPKDADYLFLLGYVAWFEGQRVAAVDYFQQSRALAAEPRWADLFLKAAKAN